VPGEGSLVPSAYTVTYPITDYSQYLSIVASEGGTVTGNGTSTGFTTETTTTTSAGKSPSAEPGAGGLSEGAKVGLGVGVGAGVPLIVGIIIALLAMKAKRKRKAVVQRGDKYDKPELHGQDASRRGREVLAPQGFAELEAKGPAELSGQARTNELGVGTGKGSTTEETSETITETRQDGVREM
jgi:hypothetical protein